jgi:predicted ATPase
LTSFIGREEQMSDVEQLLAAHRLVTLTGAGGCGKTRLALQLAADLLEAYPDGVWLVELAALADPALVSQRVASVLGVQEEPGCPLVTTLTAYLRPRSLLLVLDNCEHLLAASTQLGETLLRACPNLRILATSREGLGLLGEQTYRVPSLSLPDPRSLPPLEQLQAVEAVRLFVDRALLCRPTFALTPANAASVAEVCHRLDGIPLAIELAAARAKVLPVEQVAARLDDRFRLLTGGSRTALPRQQTLRALIDWSYDLLTEPERALLRRLSVFAGGWTLEAAEAVCPGDGIEAWEVLDLLTSLVEKSLAIYEEREDEARYRLLETVRQYARDRLLEAGEEAAVQARHRDWFLALAERAEAERRGSKEMEWINRLEIEHDNMRAALAWCQAETTGVEAGLRLGSALEWFWLRRGPMTEGRQWLAQLLSQGGELSLTVRIKALTQSAGLANFQMDFPTADALAAEGLALAREANDRQLIADCLSSGVRMLFNRGRPELAAAMTEEGLALAREVGEPGPIADWLLCRAWVATNQGVAPNPCDEELALSLYMESLALFRELGDKASIARVLPYCAQHYWFSGNVDQANAMLQEALAVNRQLGDPYATVWSLAVLGHFTRQREEYVVARAHFEERLVVSRELPDKRLMVGALLDLAQVAHAQGDATKARDLLVEARPLCQELGDRNGEANACMVEGDLLLDLGDYAAARSCYEECLAMRRAAGQTWAAAWALLGVGQAVRLQGEPGVAHSHAREAHAMFQECGDKSAIAWSLSDLGRAVGDQGDLAAARQLLEESLAIFRTQGKKGGIGRVLERLAAVAVAQAEPERAARLFGSAEGLREAMGAPLPPAERAEHERSVAAVRTSLGEETFATAWAAGRAMPMEEAVSYALEKEAPQ